MKTKWISSEKKASLTPFDINVDYNILKILANRGINNKEEIINFLNPKLENLENPIKLRDLELASNYILKAINENKKIFIYGDYDVDGITSTSLLYLSLKRLGAKNISYYIPLRNEGYGLNKNAISFIKEEKADLIITVDCGISSHEEVDYINSLGMDIIITDHHDLSGNTLPNALACINPKRLDNDYSFPLLAGVGVAFMLSYNLFRKQNILNEVFDFLDLVAMGTISDIMPLVKENRILVKYGLEKLSNSKNLGLKTLINKLNLDNKELTSGDISFKLAPIFNASGRLSDAKIGVKLLISDNISEIKMLTDVLISNNIDRKNIQEEIINRAIKEIEEKRLYDNYIIISHSPEYHHGIIGIVSSKLLELYNKPSIVMEENLDEGLAIASCRSIDGFNITKALSKFSKYLVKFGGHANAAGFTIELSKLEEFKKELYKYSKEELQDIKLVKNISIDMKIPAQKISYEFIQSLNLLKPFGFGNPTPMLHAENCIIHNLKKFGQDDKHLKFDIEQKGFNVKNATWFNKGNFYNNLKVSNIFYDILFKLELNEYKGRFYPNIYIEDMKNSKLKDDRFHFYHSLFFTSFPIKSIFYTTIDVNIDDKVYIKRNYKNYSIMKGQKSISKLDDNISNLLFNLQDFYNYDFEIKLESVVKKEEHNVVNILIKRKYLLENYTNQDIIMFRNIKKFLIGNLEYNEFSKEVLSFFYKKNKSILINENNINIFWNDEKIKITSEYYYNILLTIGIKYYFDNNKKMNFYTNNKYYINNSKFKPYFNFKDKISSTDVDDICIYDFYSIYLPTFKLKFNKSIIFCNKNFEKENIYIIKKEIFINKNIVKFDKSEIKNISYDDIFLHYLPINKKNELINKSKNSILIYSDYDIINYI